MNLYKNMYFFLFIYIVKSDERDQNKTITNNTNAWLKQNGSMHGENETKNETISPFNIETTKREVEVTEAAKVLKTDMTEVRAIEVINVPELTPTEMAEVTEMTEQPVIPEVKVTGVTYMSKTTEEAEISKLMQLTNMTVIEASEIIKEAELLKVTEVNVATQMRVLEVSEATETQEETEGATENETLNSTQKYRTTVLSPTSTTKSNNNGSRNNGSKNNGSRNNESRNNGSRNNRSEEVKKSDFGFSTIGYVRNLIDGVIITTTTEHPIVNDVLSKVQNKTYDLGYFTGFLIKLLEIIPKKTYNDQVELTRALGFAFSNEYHNNLLEHMGQAEEVLLRKISELNRDPPDLVRSQAIWAKEMLEHKEIYLANDTNEILNKLNRFYLRAEGKNLIRTLPLIYEYPMNNLTAMEVVEKMIREMLIPYYRASEAKRWETFRPINEALKKRGINPRRSFKSNVQIKERYMNRRPDLDRGRNKRGRNRNGGGRNIHNRNKNDGGRNIYYGNINKERGIIHDRSWSDRDGNIYYNEQYHENIKNDRHIHDAGRNYDDRGGIYDRSDDSRDRDLNYHDHLYDRNGNHHRGIYHHDRSTNMKERDGNIDLIYHHSDHFNDGRGNVDRHHETLDRIRNLDDSGRNVEYIDEHFHDGRGNKHDTNRNNHRVPFSDDRSQDMDDRNVNDDMKETPYKIKLVVKNKNGDFEKDYVEEREYEYNSGSEYSYEKSQS